MLQLINEISFLVTRSYCVWLVASVACSGRSFCFLKCSIHSTVIPLSVNGRESPRFDKKKLINEIFAEMLD
jgi:hypothetical protein